VLSRNFVCVLLEFNESNTLSVMVINREAINYLWCVCGIQTVVFGLCGDFCPEDWLHEMLIRNGDL